MLRIVYFGWFDPLLHTHTIRGYAVFLLVVPTSSNWGTRNQTYLNCGITKVTMFGKYWGQVQSRRREHNVHFRTYAYFAFCFELQRCREIDIALYHRDGALALLSDMCHHPSPTYRGIFCIRHDFDTAQDGRVLFYSALPGSTHMNCEGVMYQKPRTHTCIQDLLLRFGGLRFVGRQTLSSAEQFQFSVHLRLVHHSVAFRGRYSLLSLITLIIV